VESDEIANQIGAPLVFLFAGAGYLVGQSPFTSDCFPFPLDRCIKGLMDLHQQIVRSR